MPCDIAAKGIVTTIAASTTTIHPTAPSLTWTPSAYAIDELPLEVEDHPHAAPGAAEEGVHDDDRGGEEGHVGGRPKAAEVDDALEQLSVEDEPDDRLDQQQRDPDRLPHEVAPLAEDHEPRVARGLHAAASSSSAANSRPV
jgi:hypothetical protein